MLIKISVSDATAVNLFEPHFRTSLWPCLILFRLEPFNYFLQFICCLNMAIHFIWYTNNILSLDTSG